MTGSDTRKRFLLLLPSYPSELRFDNFKVAFEPPLDFALQRLSKLSQDSASPSLDIAVQIPVQTEPDYHDTQYVLGTMYKLVASISTVRSIDIRFDNEVDCRVHLYYFQSHSNGNLEKGMRKFANVSEFAISGIQWDGVMCPEGEGSEAVAQGFLKSFETLTRKAPDLERVPGGLTVRFLHGKKDAHHVHTAPAIWHTHDSVAVGGTFDHLHDGHKLLLSMMALVQRGNREEVGGERRLTIGITGDALLKNKKFADFLESWTSRQSTVQSFLLGFLLLLDPHNKLQTSRAASREQAAGRKTCDYLQSGIEISYVEIFDAFGPTITDSNISALVISGETRSGGKAVNEKRIEQKWKPLEVFEVDVLDPSKPDDLADNDDFQSKISSTEIRSKLYQKRIENDGKSLRS